MNVWKHAPVVGLLGGLAYGAAEVSIALWPARGVSLGFALAMLAATAAAGLVLGAAVGAVGRVVAGGAPAGGTLEGGAPGGGTSARASPEGAETARAFLLAEMLRPRVLALCAAIDAGWIAFALAGLLQDRLLHGEAGMRARALLVVAVCGAGATVFLALLFRHLTRRRRFVVAPALDLWILAVFLAAAARLNRTVLPGFLDPVSLAANLGLLAATLGIRVLAGRRLHGSLEAAGIRVKLPRGRGVAASGLLALALVLASWAANREGPLPLPPRGSAGEAVSRAPGAGAKPDPVPRTDRPNVVLIVLDTARADRFGFLGYPRATTPRIDALAEESVVYTRARSPSSWTLPAHGSLFTGLYPTRHGAHASAVEGLGVDRAAADGVHNDFLSWPLGEDNVTLAEVLREAGWTTAGIVANSGYLSRIFGMDQGFATWDDRPGVLLPGKEDLVSLGLLRLVAPRATAMGLRPYRSAGETNRSVFRWLDEAAREPFFLFVNYMDVHAPLLPPAPFDRRFQPGGQRPPSGPEVAEGVVTLDDDERMRLDGLYDGALNYLDAEVGRLLDRLDDQGVLDRTILVLTSDHGEMLGEHDLVGHFDGLHEEVLRVPLIVRFPRTERFGVVEDPVSLVQVMPMLLEQLGLPLPGTLSEPGAAGTTDYLLAEQYENASLVTRYGDRFRGVQRAVIDDPWKLLWRREGPTTLWDLEEDPQEHVDRALDEPERVAEMRGFLEQWRRSIRPVAQVRLETLDPESRERLRALGY